MQRGILELHHSELRLVIWKLKASSFFIVEKCVELVTQYLLGLEDGQEQNVATNFISFYYPEERLKLKPVSGHFLMNL